MPLCKIGILFTVQCCCKDFMIIICGQRAQKNVGSFMNSGGGPKVSFHAPMRQKLPFSQVWGEKVNGDELAVGQP